ncbi:TPA: hypothetical protein DIT45_04760 [Candidatus Acetothermia bacterium]|nr:hypothetical protein [Candidatus Acetothermia bacterium]
MPLKLPKYVDTVRRLIYWQYAQLIAKAAGFAGSYGFVLSRYKKLDDAVLDAYGWHHDLTDDEIFERLLALNLERTAGREGGTA